MTRIPNLLTYMLIIASASAPTYANECQTLLIPVEPIVTTLMIGLPRTITLDDPRVKLITQSIPIVFGKAEALIKLNYFSALEWNQTSNEFRRKYKDLILYDTVKQYIAGFPVGNFVGAQFEIPLLDVRLNNNKALDIGFYCLISNSVQ